MKFSETILLASLATAGLASSHRSRHARFHEKRGPLAAPEDVLELHARALAEDPTLVKRCGEMINSSYNGAPMSFPNCFGACEGKCGGSAPAAASPAPAAASPAPAAASPSPQPAAESPAVNINKAQPSAAAASSPSPAPASGGSSSSASSSKKGLAYNDASFITGSWLQGGAISWAYNWAFSQTGLNSKLQFVPMFHDMNAESSFMSAQIPAGAPVLSLNEPDMTAGVGGSSVTPANAAAAHQKVMKPLAGSHKIGSPAVSSSNSAGQGLDWLSQFGQACAGQCPVDFVPIHWYGYGQPADAQTQATAFLNYVDEAAGKVKTIFGGSKPLWVTEFGAVNGASLTDANLNAAFLKIVIPKLESNSNVERYSPFMVGPGGALGEGTPSVAGQALLSTS